MKDKLKKVFASLAVFALALGVVVASAVPAQAAVTVTINNNHPSSGTEDGPSYNWYVMMWASIGSGNAVSYYVTNQELATALDGLSVDGHDMFTVTRVGDTDQWNVVLNDKIAASGETQATAFTGEEVAAALDSIKDKALQSGTVARSTDSNKTFDIDDNGYVLIESSLGTKLLADTFSSKTVTEKNTYPTSDKKQSKTADGTYTDDTLSAEIGQTIYYHVDITVPSTASKAITVVDTISSGLTLNSTVNWTATHGTTDNGTWTEDATREATAPAGSKVYTFTISEATVQQMAQNMRDSNVSSTTVTISYSATVNSNAITVNAETNKAHIEYDNYVTPDDEVDVYTYRFNLLKYDAAVGTGSQLAGATFQLLKGDSKTPVALVATDSSDPHYQYRVATSADSADQTVTTFTTFDTISGHNIEIAGLDKNETYYLRETAAPAGYSRLAEDVQVNFDTTGSGSRKLAGDNLIPANPVVQIENHQGSVLPSTGGMGTTVFYIVGAVLIAGGVTLFVMNRKKNAASRS